MIEALLSGRHAGRVKPLLKTELSKTFVYLQRALPLIHSRIDAFKEPLNDAKKNVPLDDSEE